MCVYTHAYINISMCRCYVLLALCWKRHVPFTDIFDDRRVTRMGILKLRTSRHREKISNQLSGQTGAHIIEYLFWRSLI